MALAQNATVYDVVSWPIKTAGNTHTTHRCHYCSSVSLDPLPAHVTCGRDASLTSCSMRRAGRKALQVLRSACNAGYSVIGRGALTGNLNYSGHVTKLIWYLQSYINDISSKWKCRHWSSTTHACLLYTKIYNVYGRHQGTGIQRDALTLYTCDAAAAEAELHTV